MKEVTEPYGVLIYPHADDTTTDRALVAAGKLYVSVEASVPEVLNRLQLWIQYQNGMTRDQWEELKRAGDRAFELAEKRLKK